MRARFVLIIIVSVIIVSVAAFGTIEYTSRPPFCNSCHEMSPMYQAWAKSAHKEVSCIRCHADPGLLGLLGAKLGAFKDGYYHITGTYKKPIKFRGNPGVFNKRCLACHKNKIGQNDAHNKTHFDNGMACIDCHVGLVHDDKTNKKPPSRDICRKCHQS